MLHRFDLHVHSFFSGDAASSPEELVAAARAKGLAGIAITDHNSCESAEYCLRHGLAREDGMPVDGFLIVPGVEVSTAEGHLLCIGVTMPLMIGIFQSSRIASGICLEHASIAVLPFSASSILKFSPSRIFLATIRTTFESSTTRQDFIAALHPLPSRFV